MALEQDYGTRIAAQANAMAPVAGLPTIQQPLPAPIEELSPMGAPSVAPAATEGGFPGLVMRTQGTGPKLDKAALDALVEQYATERVRPREFGKKGASQANVDATDAAFRSAANRWITDYLGTGTAAPAAGDDVTGRSYLNPRGLVDTLVSMGTNTIFGIPEGITRLAEVGIRANNARMKEISALLGGASGDEAAALMRKVRGQETGTSRVVADFADAISDAQRATENAMISDETRKAEQGMSALYQNGASAGELAQYIGNNPSALAMGGGQLLSYLVPTTAGAKILGTAGKVEKGAEAVAGMTRLARAAAKVKQGAPLAAVSATDIAGRNVAQLHRQARDMSIEQLTQTPRNKALWDSFGDLGLPEDQKEAAFRRAIVSEGEQAAVLAGIAEAGLSLGLGMPLERGAARLAGYGLGDAVAPGAARRIISRAAGGGVEEAISSIPGNIAQNVSANAMYEQNTPLLEGVGTGALIEGTIGAGIGAGLGIPRNPLRKPRADTTQTPPTAPLPNAANTTTAANVGAGPAPAPAAPVPPQANTQTATVDAKGKATTTETPTTGLTFASTAPGQGVTEEVAAAASTALGSNLDAMTGSKRQAAALGKLDPEGVLAQANTMAMDAAGEQWPNMTALERISLVEQAAEAINKIAKQDSIPGVLQSIRTAAAAAANPVTPTPAANPDTPIKRAKAAPAAAAPAAAPVAAASPPESTQAPAPATAAVVPPAPATETAPAPAQTEIEIVETPPTASITGGAVPEALGKAKAVMGSKGNTWKVNYESGIDKALHLLGAPNQGGAAQAELVKYVTDAGIPEAAIPELATMVRQRAFAQGKGSPTVAPVPRADMQPILDKHKPPVPKPPSKNKLRKVAETPAPKAEEKPAPTKKPLAKKAVPKPPEKKTEAKPAEKKPLAKKVPKPPKADAPAATSGQTERSEIDAAVAANAPDLPANVQKTLADTVEIARQGDTDAAKELRATLKEHVEDGTITDAQRKALLEAARPRTTTEQGYTEASDITVPEEGDVLTQSQLHEPTKHTATAVLKSLSSMKGNTADVRPVLEAVMADPEATRAQKWLAEKLIPLIEANGVKLSGRRHPHWANDQTTPSYNPGFNTLKLPPGSAGPEVILHEALHAITSRMLIVKSKSADVTQFQQDMDTLWQHVRAELGKPENKPVLAKLYAAHPDNKLRLAHQNGFVGNPRELLSYGLTNEGFRQALMELPAPAGYTQASNAWDAFRSIIRGVWQKVMGKAPPEVASAFDALLDHTSRAYEFQMADPSIAKGIDALATSHSPARVDKGNIPLLVDDPVQDMVDNPIFSEEDYVVPNTTPVKEANKDRDTTQIKKSQRLWELLAHAGYGIEKSVQNLIDQGAKVADAVNPYYAYRKYGSDITEYRETDQRELVTPIQNWIYENFQKGSFNVDSIDSFRKNLDKFLQGKHVLSERMPTLYAETVPLRAGKEVERAKLIDDAYDGKITGRELNRKLRALAREYHSQDFKTWAKKNKYDTVIASYRKQMAQASALGVKESNPAVKELNTLLEGLRSRDRERKIASGLVSKNDPFADRGWDWYVPLKGNLKVPNKLGDLDVGYRKGSTKAFRSQNLKTLEGRETVADNAMSQMLTDLGISATAQAEGEFKSTLYDYVIEHKKALGAKVRTYTGTPKEGYTEKGVKDAPTLQTLPNPPDGFVYNDGDTHYVVTLPPGDQLVRGLQGLRSIVYPSSNDGKLKPFAKAFERVGRVTNFLARAYTTWSPTWQLTTAFVRDMNALPLTVAMETFDSPLQATAFTSKYYGKLARNTLDLNSEDFQRRLAIYRKAGGNTTFTHGLNKERADDALYAKLRKSQQDLISLDTAIDGLKTFDKLTGDWAAFLENKGRLAAFEALVETGVPENKAAALVKGSLDYGQSGEYGKMVNTFYAFYRVGATSLDTIRRIFTKKDGSIDVPKLRNWLPAMWGMGYAAYAMAAAAFGDDDDGVPKIKKYTAETLAKGILLPIPGSDKAVSMAMAPGLQQLMFVPGVLAAAYNQGNITAKEAADALYDVLGRAAPIQPSGIHEDADIGGAVGTAYTAFVPTAIRPLEEVRSNINSFGRPIHRHNVSDDKFKWRQAMPNTPEMWVNMAKELHEATGGAIDMYPETLQHVAKAYGGQNMNDLVYYAGGRDSLEKQGGDAAAFRFVGQVMPRDAEFYYARQGRKIQSELKESKRRMDAELGDKPTNAKKLAWMSQNPEDRARIQALDDLNDALDDYYKGRKAITGDKLLSVRGRQDKRKLLDSSLRKAIDKANVVIERTEE